MGSGLQFGNLKFVKMASYLLNRVRKLRVAGRLTFDTFGEFTKRADIPFDKVSKVF